MPGESPIADQLLTLVDAVRLGWMPRRNGRPLHPATLRRLILAGRLKASRVGSAWVVCERDLREAFRGAAADALAGRGAPVARREASSRPSDAIASAMLTSGDIETLRRLRLRRN